MMDHLHKSAINFLPTYVMANAPADISDNIIMPDIFLNISSSSNREREGGPHNTADILLSLKNVIVHPGLSPQVHLYLNLLKAAITLVFIKLLLKMFGGITQFSLSQHSQRIF